jgi:hypothetical protein
MQGNKQRNNSFRYEGSLFRNRAMARSPQIDFEPHEARNERQPPKLVAFVNRFG